MSNSILYLLDTNTVSYFLKEQSPALRDAWSIAERTSRIAISTVTLGELRFGLENNPSAIRMQKAVNLILARVEVLAWDVEAAHTYGVLRHQLAKSGKTLATLDLMIAAHAQSRSAVLVTRDKAFRYLEDRMKVINWATDLK